MYGLVAAGELTPPCAGLAYSHEEPTMTLGSELHIVILPLRAAMTHGMVKRQIKSVLVIIFNAVLFACFDLMYYFLDYFDCLLLIVI